MGQRFIIGRDGHEVSKRHVGLSRKAALALDVNQISCSEHSTLVICDIFSLYVYS